jgi:hypothetical protein
MCAKSQSVILNKYSDNQMKVHEICILNKSENCTVDLSENTGFTYILFNMYLTAIGF